MSDTNFRPASSTGYGAGSGSAEADLGAQHPRASGMSFEADRARRQGAEEQQGYLDQASGMAEDAWRAGQDYYEHGSRRVSEWANEHPNQLWAAIAVAGAFALWMAYRPAFANRSRARFDASRYRYRRLPRPAGRAPFLDRGADRAGQGM